MDVEYVTHSCPIEGCDWSVATPRTSAFATFSTVMVAAELLAHLTSRRVDPGAEGFPQERLHSVEEIEALGLIPIIDAAGIDWRELVLVPA